MTTATVKGGGEEMKRDEKARAALLHSADTIVARLNRTMKEWDSKQRLDDGDRAQAKERLRDMDVPPSSKPTTPTTSRAKTKPSSPKRKRNIRKRTSSEEEKDNPAIRYFTDSEPEQQQRQPQQQVTANDESDDDDFDVMKVVRKRIQMANEQQQQQRQSTPPQTRSHEPQQQSQHETQQQRQQQTTTTVVQRQTISVPQVQPGAYSGAPGQGFHQQECIRFSLVGALPKDNNNEEEDEHGVVLGTATTDLEVGQTSASPQPQQQPQPPEILVEASLVTSTVQRNDRDIDDDVIKTNVVEAKELTVRDVLQIKGVCWLFGSMIGCFLIVLGALVAALIVILNKSRSTNDDDKQKDYDELYYDDFVPPAPIPDESSTSSGSDPFVTEDDNIYGVEQPAPDEPWVEPDDSGILGVEGDDPMIDHAGMEEPFPVTFAPTAEYYFDTFAPSGDYNIDDMITPPPAAPSSKSGIEDPAVVAISIAAALVVIAMIASIPIFLTFMKRKIHNEQYLQQQQQADGAIHHDVESSSKTTNKKRQRQQEQLGVNSDTEKLGINSDDTDDSKMSKSTLPSKDSSFYNR